MGLDRPLGQSNIAADVSGLEADHVVAEDLDVVAVLDRSIDRAVDDDAAGIIAFDRDHAAVRDVPGEGAGPENPDAEPVRSLRERAVQIAVTVAVGRREALVDGDRAAVRDLARDVGIGLDPGRIVRPGNLDRALVADIIVRVERDRDAARRLDRTRAGDPDVAGYAGRLRRRYRGRDDRFGLGWNRRSRGRNCTKTRRRKQESHQKPLCFAARRAAGVRLYADLSWRVVPR